MQPSSHSYPAHVDGSRLHTASSVYLGHQSNQEASSSTMATSYLPLTAHTQRVGPPARDNIPFDYYPGQQSENMILCLLALPMYIHCRSSIRFYSCLVLSDTQRGPETQPGPQDPQKCMTSYTPSTVRFFTSHNALFSCS